MAMTEKQKKGLKYAAIAGGILAAFGLASAASADDEVDIDDEDDDEDELDDVIIVPPRNYTEDPPPPPAGNLKNYVGSGYNWPRKDRYPNERSFGLALSRLGYDPGNVAAANWSPISAVTMTAVRNFQRGFNRVIASMASPPRGPVGTDGLIGKNTIDAFILAEQWVAASNTPWQTIVAGS